MGSTKSLLALVPASPLLLLFALLLECSDAFGFNVTNVCQVPRTLKFLQPAPMTGSNAISGLQYRDGILAAFRQYSNEGGLGKVNLELVVVDDTYNTTLSVAIIKQHTVDPDEIFAVLGAVGTSAAVASVPVIADRKVPYIGPKTGGYTTIRDPFNRYVINFRPSYVDEAAAIVELLLAMGKTRIALFFQKDSLGDAGHLGVIGALNSSNMYLHSEGGHSKTITNVTLLDLEILTVLTTMNSTGKLPPDAIVMATVNVAAVRFAIKVRDFWPDVTIAGLSSVVSDALVSALNATGGATLLKNLYIAQASPMHEDISQLIAVRYRQAIQQHTPDVTPNIIGFEGYLVARIVIDALERSRGVFTREAFLDAIYANGYVDMDGFRCGAFLPAQDQGGCNQCMHQVILTKALADTSIVMVDEMNPFFNFSTCGYKAKQWKKMRFGQTCSFTGAMRANCLGFRDGLLAAFRRVNDQGGIRGAIKLELVWSDDLENATLGFQQNLDYLSDPTVFGLVGTSSEAIEAVSDAASNRSKPMFGPYSGAMGIRTPFNRFVVNLRASLQDEIDALVQYSYNVLKYSRISLLYEDTAFAVDVRNQVVLGLSAKRLTLYTESILARDGSNTTDAVAQVFDQASQSPQAILFIGCTALEEIILAIHRLDKSVSVFALSDTSIDSLLNVLSSSNASSFRDHVNLDRVIVTQCVPSVDDVTVRAVTEYASALTTLDQSLSMSSAGMEGYLVGQLLATSLQRVIGTELTTTSLIDAVFDSGNFNLMGTHCGPLVDASVLSDGAIDDSKACNQCMKRVWLVSVSDTGAFRPIDYDFSFDTCMFVPSPNLDFQLHGIRLVMVLIASCCNVYVMIVFVLIICYRQHPLVRSGFKFSLVSCTGALVFFSSVYLLYPIPTNTSCALEPWAADLSFVTLFGPLFAKTYRIDKVFNNRKLKKILITDAQVMRTFMQILSGFVLFLIVWTIASRRKMQESWTPDGYRFESCYSPYEAFQYVAYMMKAMMLLWGCFLCQRVYKINGKFARFNESKQIVVCIYNTSFLALVAVLLKFIVKDPNAYFAAFTGLVIINTVITVTIMFAFPLFAAAKQMEVSSELSSSSINNTPGPSSVVPASRFNSHPHMRQISSPTSQHLKGVVGSLQAISSHVSESPLQ